MTRESLSTMPSTELNDAKKTGWFCSNPCWSFFSAAWEKTGKQIRRREVEEKFMVLNGADAGDLTEKEIDPNESGGKINIAGKWT